MKYRYLSGIFEIYPEIDKKRHASPQQLRLLKK